MQLFFSIAFGVYCARLWFLRLVCIIVFSVQNSDVILFSIIFLLCFYLHDFPFNFIFFQKGSYSKIIISYNGKVLPIEIKFVYQEFVSIGNFIKLSNGPPGNVIPYRVDNITFNSKITEWNFYIKYIIFIEAKGKILYKNFKIKNYEK